MAFEKTQTKLDELRNLTWQNGKLIEQNETLTKMLEEKDDSTLIAEIEEAKKVLADAINVKGGSAVADSSFSQLAEDIESLPISGILADGIVQTEPFRFLYYACNTFACPLSEINDNIVTVINRNAAFQNQTRLLKVKMTALTTISSTSVFQNCSSLQEFYTPNLISMSNDNFYSSSALSNIVVGKLITLGSNWMGGDEKINLRNITIGQNTDINLTFYTWTATNVIAEGQTGIDELNSNLRTNLLEKLADHSTDGITRTLRLGWLAYVTQENIDYANSKGWTLTT